MTGQFENVLSSEIDKYACITYKHLYKDDPFNDLTTDDFKNLAKTIQYDVLLAGFPCQSFSAVGKGLGFEDTTRGTIFFHIAEIVKICRPKAVFLENVDNIIRHNQGKTFHKIIDVLENELDYQVVGVSRNLINEIDYNPKDFIRNAKNFGIPQNRPRAFIIAFDRKLYGQNKALENCLPPNSRTMNLYEDLNDVIELGAEPRFYLSEGYWNTLINHRLRQVKKGYNFGYRIVNEANADHPIANTLLATGGSGKERNLIIDPQTYIPGMQVGLKKTGLNKDCVRFMTPREWGKLQGFINYAFVDKDGNDHFSFPEGISIVQQYKQFGNSVCIPVIQSMAEYILKYL